MRFAFFGQLVAAVLVLAMGCYHYVERQRPLTAAECGPPETPRAFARVSADSSRPRVIHGIILDASVPSAVVTPLSGARVQIQQRTVTQTDASGRFRIDSVAPGSYPIVMRLIGYHSRLDTVTVGAYAGSYIEVGLEPAPFDGCPGFMEVVERKRVWRWPWQ